jgi:hypothetical protein
MDRHDFDLHVNGHGPMNYMVLLVSPAEEAYFNPAK